VRQIPSWVTILKMENNSGRFHFRVFLKSILPLLICMSLAFLAYGNALNNEFVGDDIDRIQSNPKLQYGNGAISAMVQIMPDRPILFFVNWLNYLVTSNTTIGFRAVNVLLHGFCGFALWLTLNALSTVWFKTQYKKWSWIVVSLFLLHPALNQSVNLVIQRGVLLAVGFGLLSFLYYIKYNEMKNREFLLLSLLFFLIAVLAKPFAVFFFPIFLLFDRSQRTNLRSRIKYLIPFVVIGSIPFVFYKVLGIHIQRKSLPWYDYFLIQARVVVIYLRLFFYPSGLRYSYDISLNPSIFENLTWLALLAHSFILACAAWLWRKKKEYALSFAIFATYLAFSAESGFFPIEHVIFEHRIYFPFVFIAIGIWVLLIKYCNRVSYQAVLTGTTILGVIFVCLSWKRNSEISTFEKWLWNTISYNAHDTLLNEGAMLHALVIRDYDLGRKLVKLSLKEKPESGTYLLFDKLFEYPSSSHAQQKRIIDQLASILRDESIGLNLPVNFRSIFTIFILEKLPDHVSDSESLQLAESLIFRQLPILKTDVRNGHPVFLAYLRIVDQLKRQIESKIARGDRLDSNEERRYFRLLAGLDLVVGVRQINLNERYLDALKRYPKNDGLKQDYEFYKKNKAAVQ